MLDSNSLIVGIVGTANTGKTTLIKDVVDSENNARDRDYQWTLYGKDYRKTIEEKGLKINREGNEECQQVIHDTLLQNIIDASNESFHKRMVMDRTILDSFAYTYWHYRYGTSAIKTETLDKMWRQVVKFSKLYTRILYIPLCFCGDVKVVDDRFRDTNSEYRSQIDRIFAAEFLSLSRNGSRMDVIYGSREERVKRFYFLEELSLDGNLNGRNDFEHCFEEVSKDFHIL